MYMRGRLAAMAAWPLARRAPLRACRMSSSLCRIEHAGLRQPMAARAWNSTVATPPTDPVAPHADNATEESIAEEKDTGHFEVKHNEAILFFDSTSYVFRLLAALTE